MKRLSGAKKIEVRRDSGNYGVIREKGVQVVSLRELHHRTGDVVRKVSKGGHIFVTDRGIIIAKISQETPPPQVPYFARRKMTAAFRRLDASGKMGRGTDSTLAISEDREDRN